jgi:hypothetical protein
MSHSGFKRRQWRNLYRSRGREQGLIHHEWGPKSGEIYA